MKPFKVHRGLVATLNKANVDTDQIIPKQFLKKITRTGFAEHLFHDWRYLPDGTDNPDFELNQERFKGSTILVARNNFGCGSSREHAVWAVQQYGFQVIIAPAVRHGVHLIHAFADIFRNNAFKNGILTIELSEAEVEQIFRLVQENPGLQAHVDLENQKIDLLICKETTYHFDIDPAIKHRLLNGLDDIGHTLQHQDQIRNFEKKHDVQWYSSK